VLSTHYLEEAAALCDRIGTRNRGRLVASGTVAELEQRAGAGSTLDEVFARYTGTSAETGPVVGTAYEATSFTRRAVDRTR